MKAVGHGLEHYIPGAHTHEPLISAINDHQKIIKSFFLEMHTIISVLMIKWSSLQEEGRFSYLFIKDFKTELQSNNNETKWRFGLNHLIISQW